MVYVTYDTSNGSVSLEAETLAKLSAMLLTEQEMAILLDSDEYYQGEPLRALDADGDLVGYVEAGHWSALSDL